MSLGRLEETGDHAPKDVAGAYALYEKAAARGSADGAINVAVALAEGKFLQKNLARAYQLLKTAADQGSAIATFDLGKFADDGMGGAPGDALAPLPPRRRARRAQRPPRRRRAARRGTARCQRTRRRRPTNC